MRLATFRLAKAEGDREDAEVSVIPARGSETANVERWQGQFKEKPEAKTSTRDISGVRVTVAELEGTFLSGGGPAMGGSGAVKPGTRLWAAILRIPGVSELIFVKAWGPKATMEKWRPSFDELLDSIRLRR
jgi:hypothetical protein